MIVSLWNSFHCVKFLYQLPAVYNPLFDAIGAIAEESSVYLEKLYQTQGILRLVLYLPVNLLSNICDKVKLFIPVFHIPSAN